jgi:uncharacterized protein YjbI with pentapeptide repeats
MIDDKTDYVSITFSELDFSAAEITSKEFDGCTFKGCNFNEAIFTQCKFIDCHFIECNLSVAKIPQSRFSDVVFEGCKLTGIDWCKANWSSLVLYSPIKMYQCIINDSSFLGLSLKEIVIEECKAHDVDFRKANLSDANLTYTDFSNSIFGRTNLTNANFAEASNYTIDIIQNEIRGAKFSRFEAVSLLESLGVELVD